MSEIPVLIYDRVAKTLVDATLRDDLDAAALWEAEAQWKPAREQGKQQFLQLQAQGLGQTSSQASPHQVQHLHWDWALKSGKLALLAYRCLGIHCQGHWQGMMMVLLVGRAAQLSPDAGKPTVYIDYLEAAPWNVNGLARQPKYKLVGVRLVEAVIRLSMDEQCHGRLGLHSLPQAEVFYEQTCGMTRVGPDPHYGNLVYFEMTAAQAALFLSGGA